MSKYGDLAFFLFKVVNQMIFFYLIFVCLFYLVLFFIAFNRSKKERGFHNVEHYKKVKKSSFTPPLSVLVQAYNEEMGIIGTVLSLVTGSGRLDYPEYEVILSSMMDQRTRRCRK